MRAHKSLSVIATSYRYMMELVELVDISLLLRATRDHECECRVRLSRDVFSMCFIQIFKDWF